VGLDGETDAEFIQAPELFATGNFVDANHVRIERFRGKEAPKIVEFVHGRGSRAAFCRVFFPIGATERRLPEIDARRA
jgi:hypothetical protein